MPGQVTLPCKQAAARLAHRGWDRRQIAEGRALLDRALERAGAASGPYVIQAAIASLQRRIAES